MIIIKYNKKGIYFDVNVLKGNLKRVFVNLLKILTIGCGIGGVLLIFGATGLSDIGVISLRHFFLQILQGISLCIITYALCFIKNALQ